MEGERNEHVRSSTNKSKLLTLSIGAIIVIASVFFLYSNFNTEEVSCIQMEDDINIDSNINSYINNNNLIIEYSTNEDNVWIDGMSDDRYTIGDDRIIIYDYSNEDRFKLHIGDNSDIYEFDMRDTLSKIKDKGYIDSIRKNDNTNTYDGITKTYVTDSKKLTFSDDKILLDMELLTPYNNEVQSGESVMVAEWLLVDWDNKVKFPEKIDYYDLKDNYKIKDKDYTWKYLVETEVTDCYDAAKADKKTLKNANAEECHSYIGKEWIEFSKVKELPHKNIIIGLFTDTISGEYVEFIPTIEGFNIYEWASYLVTDLISYYKLDEASGTTVNDAHGSNDGTNYGATINVAGKIGKAYDFNGEDYGDYLDTNEASDFNFITSSDFTFSLWINPTFKTKYDRILSNRPPVAAVGYELTLVNDDNGTVRFFGTGGANVLSNSTSVLIENSWNHLVVTADSGSIVFYINGVATGSGSTTISSSSANLQFAVSSGWHTSDLLEGKLDEIGIWSRVLNSTEVENLWADGDGFAYPFEANNPPNITANATKPDIVHTNTDYLVNLTIEDTDIADTLTGYVQFYVNGTAAGAEQSQVVTNGTTSLIGTLDSGNFSGGDILIAQVWAGDGTVNTTKVNLTSSSVVYSPDVASLTEYPADPATFSQSTIYQFNTTVTDIGSIDDVVLTFNGTNYTASNISSNFYANIANLSVGVYNYSWFANNSIGGINNTESGSYTINKAIPEGSLTSTLGWTINETQEVTIGLTESQGGDADVVYIVSRDNVSKATGETWTPSYGTYYYVLNTTGGVNWTENISMDTKTLTVSDNINPGITIDYPVNGSSYDAAVTELNYTATDTNLNTCWYSLNGGLANTTVTCGDNVVGLNSGEGWTTWRVWANDSDNNINTTTTTFFVDTMPPAVTALTEYPADPATFSSSTIYSFNATVSDADSPLDNIILTFNGINYSASNISDNFYVSLTNLSAGTYNYVWFANDTAGNVNNSATGSYTVNKAASQTSLTFDIASPQTYGTAITPTCSVLSGDGPAVLDFNGAVISSGSPIVIAAGTSTFNCSYTETANYTGSTNTTSYIINKAMPEGNLTSTLGWAINETQEITIGLDESQVGDDDVVYIISKDNVSIGTGETWTPSYGVYYYVLNNTAGQNWTYNSSMDAQTLTVSDNVNPGITIDYPINNAIYKSTVTELNYTATDTNLNTCWYSLNGGLVNTTIVCGNNVVGLSPGEGISVWQMWVNDSDNNINTTTVTFSIDSLPPNITILTEYPSDPTNYSQTVIYGFNSTITDSSNLDTVLFEFNEINYTATNMSADIFNVSFLNLSVGVYNYRWFANDSVGNFNNSETGTYTISKNIPILTLNATTPIVYGTDTDFIGSGCPAELVCTLDISNGIYAAGSITGNYSTPGNANYTSAYANFTIVINKATLAGSITGTSPINYTSLANITANETNNNDSDVTYILYRDNVTVSNPDNTMLGAGTYYYIYNSTGGENYTANASIDSFTLIISKATAEVYAYVGNLRANYLGNNLTAKNEYLNGSLNIGLGDIKMYLDNSLINSGSPPLFNITDFELGSYYFNVTYDGNDNYTAAEEHWGINISIWYLSNLTGVFNLNAGTGDVAYDISGNSNNGTIEEAAWGDDDIDITLIDLFDYSVDEDTGTFVLINDARDRTTIEVAYVYFKYADDILQGAIIKILPGILLLLILTMIFKLFMGRSSEPEEIFVYDY